MCRSDNRTEALARLKDAERQYDYVESRYHDGAATEAALRRALAELRAARFAAAAAFRAEVRLRPAAEVKHG